MDTHHPAVQHGFVAALAAGDAEAAALHNPRWCRRHLDEAIVLLLNRRDQLAARWPAELGEDLDGLNVGVYAALDTFIGDHPEIDRESLVFATIDVPSGAVRRHLLEGRPPPAHVDRLIVTACRAILAGTTRKPYKIDDDL